MYPSLTLSLLAFLVQNRPCPLLYRCASSRHASLADTRRRADRHAECRLVCKQSPAQVCAREVPKYLNLGTKISKLDVLVPEALIGMRIVDIS